MKISQYLASHQKSFSFEFFPPKTENGIEDLFHTIGMLNGLKPTFVSVTYGAGGSTRRRTVELVQRIKREHGIEAMSHLTCMGMSKEGLDRLLGELQEGGIENVLALRGDPPKEAGEVSSVADAYTYASEFVGHIRRQYAFSLGGACYPEGHVECRDLKKDLAHLKAKVDCGLDFIITQLFFDNRYYFDFVDRARAIDINIPIIPGIMPITNVSQIKRFTEMCGASIPEALLRESEAVQDCPEGVLSIGIRHATLQCRDLLQNGAPGVHFYTLNKSSATYAILESLSDLR